MRIFLIGFMGSGKSTIGHHLSRQLGWDFADTDKIIAFQTGLSIPEIFTRHGEPWFREKEREILLSLLSKDNTVIATGGGMPCFADNMEMMNRTGITVYLRLPPEVLSDRLLHGYRERPLLQNKTPEEISLYVAETLRKREPYYNKAALIVDAANKSAEDAAWLIWKGLELAGKD
ncbi:MAG: shikimate kinase [Bacteroidales bacterium]|nr:shikimate kinase [Bacteroidales bacterium]